MISIKYWYRMSKYEEVVLDENVAYEEVSEPHTIETGDQIKVKQVLDDSIMEALKTAGYDQNYSWENKKLLLMAACCCFALTAQFYPLPFPESRLLLGICVGAYFLISCLLQYFVTFVDKDSIAFTLPHKTTGLVLHFRTEFPRFQEYFHLTIQGIEANSPAAIGKMYVGKYFTEAGEYDEEGFTKDVIAHIKRYEQKKFSEFIYDHKSD